MILIRDVGTIVTMDDKRRLLKGHSVFIREGKISAIEPTNQLDALLQTQNLRGVTIIDGSESVLLPAFINTHVHTVEHLSRGLIPDDLSTFQWASEYANPFCASLTEDEAYCSAKLACLEMISNGTGCFVDVNILGSLGHVDAIAQAVEDSGMRAILGRGVTDLWPDDMPDIAPPLKAALWHPSTSEALGEIHSLLSRGTSRAGSRVQLWASIYGLTFFSSDELLKGVRSCANHYNTPLAFHISSSREEAALSLRTHGVWPITRLEHLSVLGPDVLLTHCTLVNDHEVAIMAKRDVKVAFCPAAALRLAKGATQVGKIPEMMESGICISLGADGASSNGIFDPLRLANLTSGLYKDARFDPSLVPAETALELITREGARAIQAEALLGSIEVGKLADLTLFDSTGPEWAPGHDIPRTMIYSVDGRSIDTVIIAGEIVFQNRQCNSMNSRQVIDEAREIGARIAHRLGLDPRPRWLTIQ